MFTRVAVIALTGSRAGSNQAVMDATHFRDNLWPRWILDFEEKSCRCCQKGGKGGGEAGGAGPGRPRGHLPSCLQCRAHLESALWRLAELNCPVCRMRVMVQGTAQRLGGTGVLSGAASRAVMGGGG